MSLSTVGNIADLNNDGLVNAEDYALLVGRWQDEEVLLAEDLDRSGKITQADFVVFVPNWLWME